MLNIFRTNQLLFSVFLIFYVLLLWSYSLIFPEDWQAASMGIFSYWVYEWIGSSGLLAQSVAVVLLFIQGVWLCKISMDHRLGDKVNLFPGVFYVLLASSLPDFLHLSPILMGNTFFIIALSALIGTYKTKLTAGRIFNTGWWLSVASLFYLSFLVFIVLGIIGLTIMRAIKIKEWLMLLIGALVPYILTATYCFWHDILPFFIQFQFVESIQFFDFNIDFSWYSYAELCFFIILTIIVILSFNTYMLKKNIQVQKKLSILYWSLLLLPLSLLFQANVALEHLLIACVPLGMFLSFSFTTMSPQLAEAWHLLLLVVVLIWHFKAFFI